MTKILKVINGRNHYAEVELELKESDQLEIVDQSGQENKGWMDVVRKSILFYLDCNLKEINYKIIIKNFKGSNVYTCKNDIRFVVSNEMSSLFKDVKYIKNKKKIKIGKLTEVQAKKLYPPDKYNDHIGEDFYYLSCKSDPEFILKAWRVNDNEYIGGYF